MTKFSKLFSGTLQFLQKTKDFISSDFVEALGLVYLFLYMIISTAALFWFWNASENGSPGGPTMILATGWVGFLLVAKRSPGNWFLLDILTGNSYRFSTKYQSMGRIVGKHASTDDSETRTILKSNDARWPYGGWHTLGETFLIVEINHEGKKLRSGMKVSNKEFSLAQHGSEVPVRYQLARGSCGPGSPALIWLSRH